MRPVIVMDVDAQRTAEDYAAELRSFDYEVRAVGRKDRVARPRGR